MCGINLLIRYDQQAIDSSAITRMNRALLHRGPDAQTHALFGNVALGHTRLSIVDIEGGAQPMSTPNGRYTLTFNGEIYNFSTLRKDLEKRGVTLATHSDTEVILHLYALDGPACLEKLRGMFAFAIYDRDTGSVFIARDRLGIKPVFYAKTNDAFVASSEIKGIFASDQVAPAFNKASLRNHFFYQFSISPFTVFDNVMELPPGHTLTITREGDISLNQYWDLEFPLGEEFETLDETYWTKAFLDSLEDSVACHTIGDVPIGAYLSGGIDSSTIVWLLTKHYPEALQTFSIHFPGSPLDESHVYRQTARHLGVKSSELDLDPSRPSGFLADLEQSIYHLEQPQRLSVDVPHFLLSDLVRKAQYKVVYTGDGADELMGGYDCFRQDGMRIWGNQFGDENARKQHYFSEYTKYFSHHYVNLLFELHRPVNQESTIRRFGCYPAWHDFWHILDEMTPGLFTDTFERATSRDTQLDTLVDAWKPKIEGRHPLNQSLYIEAKTRLPGWILWKSDRLSMSHSVEARVPFMDHQLVELAARMPTIFKLNGFDEKYILKKVARPHLPPHPEDHKKKAFYSPIKEWFFTPERRELLEPYMSRKALTRSGVFNPQTVELYIRSLNAMPEPRDMNDYYQQMQLEWVLCLVLTTQILHSQFIERNVPCFRVD